MPITFEEVTASVEPEARPADAGIPAAERMPGHGAEERADALRLALAVMAERERRLQAD